MQRRVAQRQAVLWYDTIVHKRSANEPGLAVEIDAAYRLT